MWMLLVRSFHTSRLLLMNFYKQVPKISLQEVTNCQAILLQHTEPPLLSTYVPGKHNPQPHRWASPRHLYVLPLGASAPSLRPLVGSTISWDATTVYSARNKCSELAFPCQMQSWVSSLSDSDRKNGKSIFCLQQIHRPISQCQRGKDRVSKVGDGIWSSIALSVSRSTSKEDPDLLLGLLACFRHSQSGPAMNHVSLHVVWTVDTVQNFPQEILRKDQKIQWNSVLSGARRRGMLWAPSDWALKAVTGHRKSHSLTCVGNTAWPGRLHQQFHPLCMTCRMLSLVRCISALWCQQRTSESSRFSTDKLIWNNTNFSQMDVCFINLVGVLWMWRARKQNIKFTQLFHGSHTVCFS